MFRKKEKKEKKSSEQLPSFCLVGFFGLDGKCDISLSIPSASVNNLQAKVDALEKSNTKLTEEVSLAELNFSMGINKSIFFFFFKSRTLFSMLPFLFFFASVKCLLQY